MADQGLSSVINMRFGAPDGVITFPFLPSTLPQQLYKETVVVKPKVKVEPAIENHGEQKIIKTVAKLINPAIFLDKNIFPVDVDVLRFFSMLGEKQAIFTTSTTSRYVCLQVDGETRLILAGTGSLVVKGSVGEVLLYARKYCRAALRSIVAAMRMGYVATTPKFKTLAEQLSWYRKQRQFSHGLDVISKTDELGWIDQENPTNKFLLMEDEPMNPNCLHIGSGNNVSNSQLALLPFYDRVYLLDPKCRHGPDSRPSVFVRQKVEDGWDIVSDVAVGDHEGMTLDGQKQLVEDLYELRANRLIIVKIGLQRGIKARGFVRRKPRPHNLEVIIQLCEEGDTLDEIYDELAPGVISANEVRNKRMFQHEFGGIKKTFNDPWSLTHILRTRKARIPRARPEWKEGINRNTVLYQCAGGRIQSLRYVQFAAACTAETDLEGPFGILPSEFRIDRGPVRNYDPGFPCPLFSCRSVVKTALTRGFTLAYKNGLMTLVN